VCVREVHVGTRSQRNLAIYRDMNYINLGLIVGIEDLADLDAAKDDR
jgi:hypothetical protein